MLSNIIHLIEYESERLNSNWLMNLVKILFSKTKFYKFNKRLIELTTSFDPELIYFGYIFIKCKILCAHNAFLELYNEKFSYIEILKLCIDVVNKIKCKLYDISY